MSDANTPSPWHIGEKQLQARVGVAEQMEVFGRKVIRDHLPEQHRAFYQQLPFILMGTVSPEGLPWAGILAGEPGFAHSPTAQTLRLETQLDANDPCNSGLAAGKAIGLLGIELHSRRRNRLNGRLVRREHDHLEIAVEQSFGNCPQYIQLRQLQAAKAEPRETLPVERANQLSPADQAMISRADTFFVASYIEQANGQLSVDVSHRGGQAGFVRVEGNRLSIPDFAGNLHFNTLGNLLLNPRAGLLFIDFSTGDLLQLSGTTELLLEGQEVQAFQGAERLWHVQVEHVVRRPAALSLRWHFADYSPNSLMTGSWAEARARLAAMDLQQQWRPWRVVRIVEESPSVRSFYLEPSDGAGMPSFIAGQHMALRLNLTGQPRPLIRTYSLSSAPSDRFTRISVKREGLASTYLHQHLQVGSLLEGRAAQGHLRLDTEQRRPLVLLAAGIGITPLLSMLRETLYQNRRLRRHRTIWLIQAARSASELIFREELADLLQPGDTPLHMLRVLSQPEATARLEQDYDLAGHVDVALLKAWLPWDDYDFYLCGPGTFTQSLYDGLRKLNISDQRIHAESFGSASLHRAGDALNTAPRLSPATVAVPVLFQRSGKEARWTPGSGSLLELAESRGLSPEFSCRSGNCGTCKTAVLSGAVTYLHQPPEQPADGHALLCCAVPAATAAGTQPLILDL